MYFAVNKMNTDNGQDILLEKSDSIHAESALGECEAFHENVIACEQPFLAIQEIGPCGNSTLMIGVCTIKDRIQC